METSRAQLASNVSDIETATRSYTDMFGVGPAEQRAGYATVEIADPPVACRRCRARASRLA